MLNLDRNRLQQLLKSQPIQWLVIIMIICAAVPAVLSLFWDSLWWEISNLAFSLLFAIELTLRAIAAERKRDYLRGWWLDWIATIPWDYLLLWLIPGGQLSLMRLLRLPRLLRLLRFVHLRRLALVERCVYRSQRLLEKSLCRQLLLLAGVSFGVVAAFAMLFAHLHADFEAGGYWWFAIISLISSDSIFEVAEQTPLIKALTLLLSFIGIIVFNGILIAIIVNKLMEHFDELKQGRGKVIEKNHWVLLGWSDVIVHILDELEIYCEVERQTLKVVLLCDSAKSEFAEQLQSRRLVEVIVRIGNPYNSHALQRISIEQAKAVIIFGNETPLNKFDSLVNDSLVIKSFISLRALLEAARHAGRGNSRALAPTMVLNFVERKNQAYLKAIPTTVRNGELATGNCGGYPASANTVFFHPAEYTAKLLASLAANSDAYNIYNELLSYAGSEFYFIACGQMQHYDASTALSFGQWLTALPAAVPVGFWHENQLHLAPAPQTLVPPAAELLVLAPNSAAARKFKLPNRGKRTQAVLPSSSAPAAPNQVVVIIGVNSKLPMLIDELCKHQHQVLVIDNQSDAQFHAWYQLNHDKALPTQVQFAQCRFRHEDEIKAVLPLRNTRQIIILADGALEGEIDPDKIDADTFFKILKAHHLTQSYAGDDNNLKLIAEILTPETEDVVRQSIPSCAYVVGPVLIAKLLMMFALEPRAEFFFRTLIQKGEFDLAVGDCELAAGTTFAMLLAAYAQTAGSIPLGWVIAATPTSAKQVILNPGKHEIIPPNARLILLQRETANAVADMELFGSSGIFVG